jgi:hypothetical protein
MKTKGRRQSKNVVDLRGKQGGPSSRSPVNEARMSVRDYQSYVDNQTEDRTQAAKKLGVNSSLSGMDKTMNKIEARRRRRMRVEY